MSAEIICTCGRPITRHELDELTQIYTDGWRDEVEIRCPRCNVRMEIEVESVPHYYLRSTLPEVDDA